MWRLVKNQAGNRKFNMSKYIQINTQWRNNSEENSSINSKLTKSIHDFLSKMTLTLDSKSKEAEDLFSSATKKIEESLRASHAFLNKQIDGAQKSVLQLSKVSENQLQMYKSCLNQYNEEIKVTKDNFTDTIKSCTEKTVIKLETVRSQYESDLQEAKDLKKLTLRAVKECLDKKGNIQPCIEEKTKVINEKYKHIVEKLQEASVYSKKSIAELLQTVSICYKNAESEVSKCLPEIVQKTKLCIENSKEKMKSATPVATKNTIFHDDNEDEKVLEKSITILIEVPNEENNNISREDKLECLQEAKKDALNSINLVLHEIETTEKITAIIQKSHKSDPVVQDFIRYANKIIQETKLAIKKCEKDDWKEVEADILKCLVEFFDSIKLKKFELMKRIDVLKKDNKKSNLEIDEALKWISTAEDKLLKVEEIFEKCTKMGKK